MPYRLGLDIGTNSIGWCLLDLDANKQPYGVHDMGVRVFADGRGWRNLRLLSSGGTSFNRDFGMEDEDGNQLPGVSVFLKGDDGTVRHFHTLCAIMGEGHYRGMDLLSPVWNLFDLLPQGRGDWLPRLAYPRKE